jgi:hypothetical protein
MSSRRKRGPPKAKQLAPAADNDAQVHLDSSKAAGDAVLVEAGAPPPSPLNVGALAARTLSPLVHAIRTSARGMLGMERELPAAPGLASVDEAPPRAGDDAAGGGSEAQAQAEDTGPRRDQQEERCSDMDLPEDAGGSSGGKGRLLSDDEEPGDPAGRAQGQQEGVCGDSPATAAWARHVRWHASWMASRRALPLLAAALCVLLALQGATLRRQGSTLGAYKEQLLEVEGRLARDADAVAEGFAALEAAVAAAAREAAAALRGCERAPAAASEAAAAAAVAAARAAVLDERRGLGPGPEPPTSFRPPWDDPKLALHLEGLLQERLPVQDLALAACGAAVAGHSPLMLRRLSWRHAARARVAMLMGGAAHAPHPAADALLLSPRQMPGACLPLELRRAGGPTAYVEIRLPGLAVLTAIELTILLQPKPPTAVPLATKAGQGGAAEGRQGSGLRLPATAPRHVLVRALNFTAQATGGGAAGKPGAGEAAAAAGSGKGARLASIAAATISNSSLLPGPGGRAVAVLPVAGVGGAPVVAAGVRLEVASSQVEGAGFVCLHRVAVRGAPLGGGSFC